MKKTINLENVWKKANEICSIKFHDKQKKHFPVNRIIVKEYKIKQNQIKCTIGMAADYETRIIKLLFCWNPEYKYKKFGTLVHELGHVAIWLHHQGITEEACCETIQIITDFYKQWILDDTSFKRKGAK